MFKAVTKDPRLIRDSIDTISQLIDDGLFKLKKDGIELLAADRATVSVVDFKLKSSAFSEYECDEKKEMGVNLLNLLTVLKRSGASDKLTLDLNEKESKLEIVLEGDTTRKFAIPLIDISRREIPEIGQLEFPGLVEIKSNVLEQGINDADIIADSAVIETSPDEFRMYAEGNSSKSELRIKKGNYVLPNLASKEKISSRYSLEYLKKMIKGSRIADNVKILIGKDFPMKMEFKGENASLAIILAPRVSEE